MRSKIAGHDYTYCHHSMSEGAQRLAAFVVEHGIATEQVLELAFGMIADAAFDWREDRDTPHPVEVSLQELEQVVSIFVRSLLKTEEKRELPTTREGWAEYLAQHAQKQIDAGVFTNVELVDGMFVKKGPDEHE
jgi:hypothetical protein